MRFHLHHQSALALAILAAMASLPTQAQAEAAVVAAAAAGAPHDQPVGDLEALIDLHRRFLSPAQLDALRRSLRGAPAVKAAGARRVQNENAFEDGNVETAFHDDTYDHGGGGNSGNGDHGNGDNGNGGTGNGGGNSGGMMNGNVNAGHSNGNGNNSGMKNQTNGANGNSGNGNVVNGDTMTNETNGNGMMNGNMSHTGMEGEGDNDDDAEWEDVANHMMMNGSDYFCWDDGSADNYGGMMDDLEEWFSEHVNDTLQCDYGDGSTWTAGPVFNLSDFMGASHWGGSDAFNVSGDDDESGWQDIRNMSGNNMNGNSGWGLSRKNNSSMTEDDWNWPDMNGTLQELMKNWTTLIGGNQTFRCRVGNETIWQDGQMMFNMSYSNGHGGGWRQGMNFSSHSGFQNGMNNGNGRGAGYMKNHSGRDGNCGGLSAEERNHIMFLFRNAASIQRSVTPIVNGIEATTTSSDPAVALVIQQHVAEMSKNRLVRGWDPVFFELHEQHDNIQLDVTNISDGVYVVHTGDNPCAADTATAHSSVVTAFLENGMPEMMKSHDAPSTCEDAAIINSGGSSELADSSAVSLGTSIFYTVWGLVVVYFVVH